MSSEAVDAVKRLQEIMRGVEPGELAQDNFWAVKGVRFNPTSLDIPPDLDYDDWRVLGATLLSMHKGIQWWVGDWIRFGEAKYGEKYAQAMDATGISYGVLNNYVWVAEKFPQSSSRNERLTWSHHRVIADLPTPEARQKWLAKAEGEHLSSRDLYEQTHPIAALPPGAIVVDPVAASILMTKEQAIEWYKHASNGTQYEAGKYLAEFGAGKTARDRWDDPTFVLGLEYGVRIALAHVFGLMPKDVG